MAEATLFTSVGEKKGTVELPAELFEAPRHDHAMYESVKCYMANQRQGTSSVKSRSMMKGGGRKPWRQKGTGMARAGSNCSPLWVGGGRAFGPRPRDYSYRLPKKLSRLALISALSVRAGEQAVGVIESITLEAPKSKTVADMLKAAGLYDRKCLVLLGQTDTNVLLSARNLPRVKTALANQVTTYDLLNSEFVLLTQEGLEKLKEVFLSERS
jgi:large subunit ribosomal protein L4